MTTTKEQFEQRLAALSDAWITRRQLEHLAGVSPKTLRNWLATDPIPEEKTRTGQRNAQLIAREAAAAWARAKLFAPQEGTTDLRPGPRLAAEPRPMTHAPGERWRWTDIARRRDVTPGAVSNLGRAYADHPTHPFPPAGGDRKRDAAAVAAWFHWYDSERPGYAGRSEDRQAPGQEPTGRIGEVASMLRTAVAAGNDLTAESVAAEFGITPDVAARYLSRAADVVMPEYGLVARNRIPDLLPAAVREQLTPVQRRERVKTLLKRKTAPSRVLAVGGTEYFHLADVERLIAATGR